MHTNKLLKYITLIDQLFTHWKISPENKLMLLGFEHEVGDISSIFDHILTHENTRDLLDRIVYLLTIHESLRIIFPRNNNLAYGWMTARCYDFDGNRPIDIVKNNGLIGLNILNKYLEKIKLM